MPQQAPPLLPDGQNSRIPVKPVLQNIGLSETQEL
jgi:hypothetical protein